MDDKYAGKVVYQLSRIASSLQEIEIKLDKISETIKVLE
jgi:hypothetical protein